MAQIVKKSFDSAVFRLFCRKTLHPNTDNNFFLRRLHANAQFFSEPEQKDNEKSSFQERGCNLLKMTAWQIHDYGDLQELQFCKNVKMPQIQQSNECLIKVLATSVNPIDVLMLSK